MSGRLLYTFHALYGSLSWSPNGQQLVSSNALIWDLATSQQVFAYTGHTTHPAPARSTPFKLAINTPSAPIVNAAAWSPDGNWIASGDNRGSAHIWAAN